jgi:hypothetical protein
MTTKYPLETWGGYINFGERLYAKTLTLSGQKNIKLRTKRHFVENITEDYAICLKMQ